MEPNSATLYTVQVALGLVIRHKTPQQPNTLMPVGSLNPNKAKNKSLDSVSSFNQARLISKRLYNSQLVKL